MITADMAQTALVSTVVANVNSTGTAPTKEEKFIDEPTRPKTPSCIEQRPEASDVESLQRELQKTRFSAKSAQLMSHAKRPGSISNYQSAWLQWSSWCGQRHLSPVQVIFEAYPLDSDLCVVKTLNSYIDVTTSFRVTDEANQLLLGTVKPHKPVVSSTISGWIKRFLHKGGIHTEVFKAHSTKAAASTKANLNR